MPLKMQKLFLIKIKTMTFILKETYKYYFKKE